MRNGTRIAGRWVVEGALPPIGDLARWAVRDGDEVAEAVSPVAHALLRHGAREAFLQATPPVHPAALATLASADVDGVPMRVRVTTIGDLTETRLTPAEARALAGWVAPAILAGAGVCGGELCPTDLRIDAHGVPRLAPSGVVHPESLARIPFHRAPECRGDAAADAAADLFGLGVTLYRAVTGAEPFPARTPSTLRAVSPLLASAHGATTEADTLLAALLDLDPAVRLSAVTELPAASIFLPVPSPASPAPANSTPTNPASPAVRAPSALVTTARAPSVVAQAPPRAPWAVLVSLRGLSEPALRVVAARSAADLATIRQAAARGADWAVAVGSEAETGRVLRRLEAAEIPGRLVSTRAPRIVQYLLFAATAGGIALFTSFSLVFAGIALALVFMAAVNVRAAIRTGATWDAVHEQARAALDATAPESRIRAVRARIAAADLADAVAGDLREQVARLEERLDAVRTHGVELAGPTAGDGELDGRRARVVEDAAALEAAVATMEGTITRLLTDDLANNPDTSGVNPKPRSPSPN